MTKKIRQLVKELIDAGFHSISGGGNGSHRKYVRQRFSGAATPSGNDGDDAKIYQEKPVRRVLEEIER